MAGEGTSFIISTIVVIGLIGGTTFYFRKKLANLIVKIPWPKWLLFFIVGMIYIIVEETINWPSDGRNLLDTVPFLIILLIIFYGIIKLFRIKNSYVAMLVYGLMGWVNEFGPTAYYYQALWKLPIGNIILVSLFAILTYIVLVILAVTILFDTPDRKKKIRHDRHAQIIKM